MSRDTYTQYSIKLEPIHHFLWFWNVGITGSAYSSQASGYAVTHRAAMRRAHKAVVRKRRAEYYLV